MKGLVVVFAESHQLVVTDAFAEGDHRLADDHARAVHGAMARGPALAQENRLFRMINQIVEAGRLGNQWNDRFGASVIESDVGARGNLPARIGFAVIGMDARRMRRRQSGVGL